METKFLGIPLVVWGGACLVVAAIFAAVWPSNKIAPDTGALRFFILRWFHALVWLLLALSMFVRASGIGGTLLANLIALAALPVYLVFMASLLRA